MLDEQIKMMKAANEKNGTTQTAIWPGRWPRREKVKIDTSSKIFSIFLQI